MLLSIRHQLTYNYDRAVFFEPLSVRLRPRCDGHQRLQSYSLRITPAPAGQCASLDVHGNDATFAWFDGTHPQLALNAESVVQTLLDNPFDYVIEDASALSLPTQYPPQVRDAAALYLRRRRPSAAIDELASQVRDQAAGQTLAFLTELTGRIHHQCPPIYRAEGDPWPPQQTLAAGEGACRDLVVLMVDLCRSVGLAARFVSGYFYLDEPEEPPQLHAWTEVYLSGAGWRGYDPSIGLVAADRHVAIAHGPEPDDAAPTRGTFRGTQASATLDFEVDIKRLG